MPAIRDPPEETGSRAHSARENSTRLGRVALTGGPVCLWGKEHAYGGDAGTRALSLSHTYGHAGRGNSKETIKLSGNSVQRGDRERLSHGLFGTCDSALVRETPVCL